MCQDSNISHPIVSKIYNFQFLKKFHFELVGVPVMEQIKAVATLRETHQWSSEPLPTKMNGPSVLKGILDLRS